MAQRLPPRRCGCDLPLPGCVIPAGEMDTAPGLCIYYPGNIWCLLGYSRIRPSLLGLIGVWPPSKHAVCLLAAGLNTHTHAHTCTYNLIFPHKDNRAVAAGLLHFFSPYLCLCFKKHPLFIPSAGALSPSPLPSQLDGNAKRFAGALTSHCAVYV